MGRMMPRWMRMEPGIRVQLHEMQTRAGRNWETRAVCVCKREKQQGETRREGKGKHGELNQHRQNKQKTQTEGRRENKTR